MSSDDAEFVLTYVVEGTPQEFPLDTNSLLIGRAKDCGLCFAFNKKVSRLHATLSWTPDGWVLDDMSSRSGTFVNGNRVDTRFSLNDEDVITIGDIRLTLRARKYGTETVAIDHDSELVSHLGAADLLPDDSNVDPAGSSPPAAVPFAEAPAPSRRTSRSEPTDDATFGRENYYAMIGVTDFEVDISRIQSAARQRLNELRDSRDRDRSPASRTEMETISKAVVCLSNPESKRAYDIELADHLGIEIEVLGDKVIPVENPNLLKIGLGLVVGIVAIGLIWFLIKWLLDFIGPLMNI